MTILHIVPSLPSKADVALTLAQGLRTTYQIDSVFYSHKPLQENIYSQQNFDVIPPAPTALHESVPKDTKTILLHVNLSTYTNFKSSAVANDFIYQLETALNRHSIELVTIFHEIPTSKVSSFFTIKKSNQKFTRRLANLSRSVITNNRFYERHLIENSSTQIYCVNNFSRVGELESNNLLGASRCNLIIVGGADRINIYKKKSFIQQTLDCFKLNQVVDIGPPLPWSKINTRGLNIQRMGQLLKSEISDQLTISKTGILDYSRYPNCLGKSSVFNAYKAHGVVPLLLKSIEPKGGDRLTPNINYFTEKDLYTVKSGKTIAKMAHTNYSHYQTHSQAKWLKLIRGLIKD